METSSEIERNLRRNSISLPNLEDLHELNDNVQLTDDEEESDEFPANDATIIAFNKGFNSLPRNSLIVPQTVFFGSGRNSRRKTLKQSIIMSSEEDGSNGSNSPANSVTSINSLASLLREKLQVLPSTLKIKKKSPDYKTRIFVIFLFIAIVILIFFAYFLYHQQVLQRQYFENIKLNKLTRTLKIYNTLFHTGSNGHYHLQQQSKRRIEVVKIHLGENFDSSTIGALPCLPDDQARGRNGSICLEWMDRARLYLDYYELVTYRPLADDDNTNTNNNNNQIVKCYNLQWQSLSENVWPTDCFHLPTYSHWYGGGQTGDGAWPLEKTRMEYAPFITGKVEKHHLWGNVLKRFFITSSAMAVLIDDKTPLQIAINTHDHSNSNNNSEKNKRTICLRARYDNFAYVNHVMRFPHLNYTVCTGDSMTQLHARLIDGTLWDGLKKDDIDVIDTLLTEPLWEITASNRNDITEETISNYTEDVISLGFLKQGHVLINEFWQKEMGDLTVDTERFPTLRESINIMHRRGFRIVFTVQPFISTESVNFAECVRKRLLMFERASDKRIPALTRYKSAQSAAVLDITNVNRTVPWLQTKLKTLINRYKFDAYYLDLGVAYNLPHYFQCSKHLLNPDHYKTQFINSLNQVNLNLFGVSSAIERPPPPTFISLPAVESTWDGLRHVIPTILTYGLIGYPFLMPGAVGGDPKLTNNNNTFANNLTGQNHPLPDKELYVRWLQLATFLPVMRFTHLPNTYGDETIVDLAKISSALRQNKVTPVLKKYAKIALNTGLPLIRPLWMLDGNDPATHTVPDEFAIGEELIVAPVLSAGVRQREVYLPAGVWKDGIDGSLRKGNRWIHDYRVEFDQIAYFERMPDNTRF